MKTLCVSNVAAILHRSEEFGVTQTEISYKKQCSDNPPLVFVQMTQYQNPMLIHFNDFIGGKKYEIPES